MHSESDEVGKELRNGHGEAREVNFVENPCIGGECGGGLRDATLEITPTNSACQEKEHGRHFACGNFGDLIEHQSEHEAGEERLEDIPQGAEDGLFVAGDEIPVDETINQVAIFPQFTPWDMEDGAMRGDHGGPVPSGNGLLGSIWHERFYSNLLRIWQRERNAIISVASADS